MTDNSLTVAKILAFQRRIDIGDDRWNDDMIASTRDGYWELLASSTQELMLMRADVIINALRET